MRERIFQSISVVLVLFVLLLSGCGDSNEVKSKRLLTDAETLIKQGDELQAEQILVDLVARYPETPSGSVASKHLDRIKKQRELQQRDKFAKILDSYQKILKGYYALYTEYPRSISALDQSEYFFDSAYLEGITPDGYQVYLWLKDDGSGYRLWCISQQQDRGYVVEALSGKLVPFKRDEILPKLKTRFRTPNWDGKLVALLANG